MAYLGQTFPKMRKSPRTADVSTVKEETETALRMRKINVSPLEKLDEEEVEIKDNHDAQKYVFKVLPIQSIDLISFWLFLFLYILFNCVYWFQYITSY